jgi:hypothetical protein
MRPFSLGITTLVQGLYALVWFVVLCDVWSPTFNIEHFPDWTAMQAVVATILIFLASAALGVVMHTISRAVFHPRKQDWTFTILSSPTVKRRFAELGSAGTFPGGSSYEEIFAEKTPSRVRAASAYLHLLEYQIMTRAPDVFRTLQVYRDQYRLARAFILPSAAMALVLPFWAPVATLDGAGAIGPFPIIRTQLFLLSLLAALVSYAAFRERSHRYAAAKALAFTTLEGNLKRERP